MPDAMSQNAIKLLRMIVESRNKGTYNGGVDTTEEWMLEAADELCRFMLPIRSYPEHIECGNCDLAASWLATLDAMPAVVGSSEPDKITATMHRANAEALAQAGVDIAAIHRHATGVYGVFADMAEGAADILADALGVKLDEIVQPMSDEAIEDLRRRLFPAPTDHVAVSDD